MNITWNSLQKSILFGNWTVIHLQFFYIKILTLNLNMKQLQQLKEIQRVIFCWFEHFILELFRFQKNLRMLFRFFLLNTSKSESKLRKNWRIFGMLTEYKLYDNLQKEFTKSFFWYSNCVKEHFMHNYRKILTIKFWWRCHNFWNLWKRYFGKRCKIIVK